LNEKIELLSLLLKVVVIRADTMTNPGNVLYRAIAIQGGPIKAAPCILHPACLYIEYNGDTSEKRLICGAYGMLFVCLHGIQRWIV